MRAGENELSTCGKAKEVLAGQWEENILNSGHRLAKFGKTDMISALEVLIDRSFGQAEEEALCQRQNQACGG